MEIKDNYNLLHTHFKLITQFQAKEVHTASAMKPVNMLKNRSSLLPLEGSRVHLTPRPGEDGSDYINATWLQGKRNTHTLIPSKYLRIVQHTLLSPCFLDSGFRRLRDFIVTQHPLVNTINDFWQMIWDHNVQTIVLLSSLDDIVSDFEMHIRNKFLLNGVIDQCSLFRSLVVSTVLARRFVVH